MVPNNKLKAQALVVRPNLCSSNGTPWIDFQCVIDMQVAM